jgi:hypothetical protein
MSLSKKYRKIPEQILITFYSCLQGKKAKLLPNLEENTPQQ